MLESSEAALPRSHPAHHGPQRGLVYDAAAMGRRAWDVKGPRANNRATLAASGLQPSCGKLNILVVRNAHHPPDPEIPDSRSPDSRFGRESPRGGNSSPIPDSAGTGNREIPRFPIWPGIGNRGPDGDWPQIGKSGIPVCVSPACTILGWMLP